MYTYMFIQTHTYIVCMCIYILYIVFLRKLPNTYQFSFPDLEFDQTSNNLSALNIGLFVSLCPVPKILLIT